MNNTLAYRSYRPDGIFGLFTFEGDANQFMVTLSHAYRQPDGSWKPIVLPGRYLCIRGVHALKNGIPFETFEVTGVAGHSGLLFHPGNLNKDSHGCTLTGEEIKSLSDGSWMVTNSKAKFDAFMKRLRGVHNFYLDVRG